MCNHENLKIHRSHGVTVSTQDSESCDPSSNLGRTWCYEQTNPNRINVIVKKKRDQNKNVKAKWTIILIEWSTLYGCMYFLLSVDDSKHVSARARTGDLVRVRHT